MECLPRWRASGSAAFFSVLQAMRGRMEPLVRVRPKENAMSGDDSIIGWVRGLEDRNPEAAQRLWERYFAEMVRLAGQKLPRHGRRAFDEEDVALSAFKSFCAGVEQGRFPRLADRDDLWRLLVTITAR